MSFTVFMICAICNDFRSELFDFMSEFYPSFTDLTSVDKFNVIMSDGNHCYRVAKFANEILCLRQSVMYNKLFEIIPCRYSNALHD